MLRRLISRKAVARPGFMHSATANNNEATLLPYKAFNRRIATNEYNKLFAQPELDSSHTRGRFDNRVAIVTGGASGIGRSTVERFSNDGAAVGIFDINEKQGLFLQNEMQSQGKNVQFFNVDVSDREQCIDGVQQLADSNGGRIHYLVNNAYYLQPDSSGLKTSTENFKKTLDVCLLGTSNMVQACYPYMEKENDCAVVNISSFRSQRAKHPTFWAYSSSKGAIVSLTTCQAFDLRHAGIRVNCVTPGYVWTPASHKLYQVDKDEVNKKIQRLQMLGGYVESAGVASAITFLCSADARYITGVNLPIDGGYLVLGPDGMSES